MTHEEREAIFERRRIIGLVLAEYARYRKAGHQDVAEALDVLATKIEHPELEQSELAPR